MRLARVGVLLAGLLLGVSATGCSPAAVVKKPTLLIYGDSLTVLSEPATHLLYDKKFNIVFRAAGGTSMCDWTAHAAVDREVYRPARVVIAFTGNAASCSASDLEHGGVSAWLANYQRSLMTMHHVFGGVPIAVVAAPAMGKQPARTWYPENGKALLNDMYASMCAAFAMRYDTRADDTLTPGHRFSWERPAFPGNGPMVTVRTTDGVHLLPEGQLYYAAALGSPDVAAGRARSHL